MFYPLFMNLSGKSCLVVGGGRIALRKVIGLLRAKAAVTVVAPDFCKRFSSFSNVVIMVKRPFELSDIRSGLSLVIGATNNQEVNRSIFECSEKFGILCNIVDQPNLCSFYVPAVVRRGDVTVALSTSGAAPRLAKYLKVLAGRAFGPELAPLAAYLATIRLRLMTTVKHAPLRLRFWEEIFTKEPLQEIAECGFDGYRQNVESSFANISKMAGKNEDT